MKASLCIVATGAGPIIPTSDNPYFTLSALRLHRCHSGFVPAREFVPAERVR